MTKPKGTTVAYITAGAAGMYCGSCMHDNTLARALTRLEVDVQLVPVYTPIRTDEEDVSIDQVFFGGVNVFLEQVVPLYRYLPARLSRVLDRPWLIRWATSRATSTNARTLGALTVSMLKGTQGRQRSEVNKLCSWLAAAVKPQLLCFSNFLIAGCVPQLKAALDVPVLVTLQGDDIFLDSLPEPYRQQSFAELQRLVQYVDGFLVHSNFYAEYMQEYLGISASKLFRVPLGIDLEGFSAAEESASRPPTIGYLARLAPEKGLHHLVDAFIELRSRERTKDVRLRIAGWLGANHQTYANEQFAKLKSAGHGDAFEYTGSVDRSGKVEFLRQLDVLSVPTVYREPKGLFVLEALAAGVPVVQPSHGAFPELLERLGGGRLVAPNDPLKLADQLEELLADQSLRRQLSQQGRQRVHEGSNAEAMARATWETFQGFL